MPPKTGQVGKQTRRRNVLSCVECHRRKEKCDRELPCKSCAIRPGAVCYYEAPRIVPEQRRARLPVRNAAESQTPTNGTHREGPCDDVVTAATTDTRALIPPDLFPLGSGHLLSLFQSKWTPLTATCPLMMHSTTVWAHASLEAFQGLPGSRETMWHRGKVLGLVAQRINHMGHFMPMTPDLDQAVVLLAQIELRCDDLETAKSQIGSLRALSRRSARLDTIGLRPLIKDFTETADAVVAFMTSQPFGLGIPTERPRSYFECQLLPTSPLSPLEFSGSCFTLRLSSMISTILVTMKQLCMDCVGASLIKGTFPDDDSCADLQEQPPGIGNIIGTSSAIWTRSLLSRVPFAHVSNALDRHSLFDALYALEDIEGSFRYMPGVLLWVMLTASAAVGPGGFERRFLMPALQRWCIAITFCAGPAAVIEMLANFRQVEEFVSADSGSNDPAYWTEATAES